MSRPQGIRKKQTHSQCFWFLSSSFSFTGEKKHDVTMFHSVKIMMQNTCMSKDPPPPPKGSLTLLPCPSAAVLTYLSGVL